MKYILLALSTLTAAGKIVIFKKIGVDSESMKQLLKMNGISFLIGAFMAVAATGFHFEKLIHISSFSFCMSLMFAASMIITYISQMIAMSLGTSSSTMLIYSCGFLIPVFFGTVCYHEKISIIQILAVFLLLAALFLIINPEKGTKLSVRWLLFSVLAMTGSGTIAVLQKIHQRSEYAGEFSLLLSWSFLITGAILFVIMSVLPKTEKRERITEREAINAVISGVFIGLLNLLNLRIAGKIPAIILFPIYNIGSLILSGIVCAIVFKEKNGKKQIIGFAMGCVAILFIGIF